MSDAGEGEPITLRAIRLAAADRTEIDQRLTATEARLQRRTDDLYRVVAYVRSIANYVGFSPAATEGETDSGDDSVSASVPESEPS